MKAAALIGLVALALAAYAEARPATVVLDRTLVCTTQYGDVDVMASPKGSQAFATAQMESSGFVGVGSGQVDQLNSLVTVRARAERSEIASARAPQGVYARAGRCFLSRKTVPLTSKGLPSPPVAWEKSYSCTVRGRVVVRVRAVLATAASWRRIDTSYFGAKANVVSAALAVRSERTGKPLGYGTLSSAGKTKLWVAGSCG
jgi:hypothetical protein